MEGTRLITHAGAKRMTYQELDALPVPEQTETWQPIKFTRILDTVYDTLFENDRAVYGAQYSATEDGRKFFGVMNVRSGMDGYDFALGLRSSNDKTISIQMVVGPRVFVCDNLAFSGDFFPLRQKHHQGVNLDMEIRDGVYRAVERFGQVVDDVQWQKNTPLLGPARAQFLLQVFDLPSFPTSLIRPLMKEIEAPRYQEFTTPTVWGVTNCVTEIAKGIKSVNTRFKFLADLSALTRTLKPGFDN